MKYADLRFEPHPVLGRPESMRFYPEMRRYLAACADWTEEQLNAPIAIARVEFPNGWTLDVLSGMLGLKPTANWETSLMVWRGDKYLFACDGWTSHETVETVEHMLNVAAVLPDASKLTDDELRLARDLVSEEAE
jgi:hypothetical protein